MTEWTATRPARSASSCKREEWGATGIARALDWLREDAGGKLGRTSKAAWVKACGYWDKLKGQAVETV